MTRVPEAGAGDEERRAALADRCHRLVRFLQELAVGRGARVRTVDEHPLVLWLSELPASAQLAEHAGPGEVLLTAPAAAALPPPPPLPAVLAGRVDLPDAAHADPVNPPAWLEPDPEAGTYPETNADIKAKAEEAYREWLPAWRTWAGRARADAERRALHTTLHAVAARLAQEGDALELVLATGLLTWRPAGGPLIREHLLTTRLTAEIDPVTSDLRVRVPAGASTRLGDGPLLDDQPGFRRERTNSLHDRLRDRPPAPLGPDDARALRDWLTVALDVPTEGFDPGDAPPPAPAGPAGPRLAFAPALVLRVRDQAALLSYYERMIEALRGGGPPPLGLAQLVATLDTPQRLAWLAAEGATSGAVLGADPLLPLPTSPEQARVLERLGHDNGVVVEGPPGTGKTHTIANLICALLAEGQRVLVTSQKAQALRVLRAKLPADLQQLCVSLTDADTPSAAAPDSIGSPELATSVSALAARRATYRPDELDRRIELAARRRTEALRVRESLADRARAARRAEFTVHSDAEVAPGWGGTRADIAARVRAGRSACGWLAPSGLAPSGLAPSALAPSGLAPSGLARPAPSPLADAEAVELYALLVAQPPDPAAGPRRRAAPREWPVPSVARFAAMVAAGERTATAAAAARAGLPTAARGLLDQLAASPAAVVDQERAAVLAVVRAVDELTAHAARSAGREWIPAALDDALAGRDELLWAKVRTAAPFVAEATRHLIDVGLHAVELPTAVILTEAPAGEVDPDGPAAGDPATATDADADRDAMAGTASLLAQAETLREHLDDGGGLRRRFRPKAQRAAEALLRQVTVDGQPPSTVELLDLVRSRLRAQLAVDAADRAWTLVGRPGQPAEPIEIRLSRLAEDHQAIEAIDAVVAARDRLVELAGELGPGQPPRVDSAADIRGLPVTISALEPVAAAATADRELSETAAGLDRLAADPAAPAELTALATAARERDPAAYTAAATALAARLAAERDAARRDELLGRLRTAHPALADVLVSAAAASPTRADDDPWPHRLGTFTAAWEWGLAAAWLARATRSDQRPDEVDGPGSTGPGLAGAPAGPVDLDAELDAADGMVAATTAELASARAWQHCLARMGAEQSAALRAYADAVAAGGTLAGRHAQRYRQAAREAMRVAQAAVPAWVMPIREVLSTIPAVRDSFDVVIVDEGSQAGLDSLFLLWLAPRVIVVGDDRQCTPPEDPAEDLDGVLDRLDALLPDVPAWLRVGFTPRSSLFGLLRTRFGEVVRLREHFRCMPEIIEWSSVMFYRDAPLVPLRQFGADRLPPLMARYVPHGATASTPAGPRNPAEADALVAQVLACAEDPRYAGLSFGVVVAQGSAQATMIRDLLAERMSAAEHLRRRLRVGTPADFQGDERDVVFLSLVVSPNDRPVALTRLEYQRRFNVAASRARDQVWLFHSVTLADLDHQDLRHSYLGYVLSTTRTAALAPGGDPPPLADVPVDRPHPAFGSLFEQRVFRALAGRGYLVTPRLEVGGQRIDLVVSGGRARFAIGGDGGGGADPGQLARDFDRERELRRAGWPFWRIRRSDFELDPEAALATLWPRLAAAGISPLASGPQAPGGSAPAGRPRVRAAADELVARWRPIALSELEGLDDQPDEPATPSDSSGGGPRSSTGSGTGSRR
ncbi:AAA domain-containing protein [Frankia sp. AgB32]|uniref:AAA domain-containing protein n=1 Tax=Frankia sp. AgB32 TaxID=631119 RepID=UPI00200C2F64|nr:AAA domain-containing protein [Frankia sp. AgB32]MCK9894919.1 AAA domain-containing protein [Frankia sp. AgB32]